VHERTPTLKESSDEELLSSCLRGESAAWDALINRYAGLIYSIPLKYGLSEADAADVFQSVCVTLLEKLDTVRAPRGLAAWLITTTSRQSMAVIRRRRREHAGSVGEAFLAPERGLPDPDLLPEDELLVLERQRVLRAAVGQLPDPCRQLIEALFSEGVGPESYRQLADHLGVPMNSLGPTRSRCLERLRRLLVATGYMF
jgi:RNA polymerase sigma factor (sigma-70 family)